MTVDYLRPFVQGASEMFATMLGVECGEPEDFDGSLEGYICGTISLTGGAQGHVTLSFPVETATQIVSELLALEEGKLDDSTLRDGVGEITNIVAGNAKAKLANTPFSFDLSLPIITMGGAHVVDMFRANETIAKRISTDFGHFLMVLRLVPAES